MDNRSKAILIRLTPGEHEALKKKSQAFQSISNYIRRALAEFSDMDAKRRIEDMNNLGRFYREFRNDLSWIGSNLNQAVKRANELSVAGHLSKAYLSEVLMPEILKTQNLIDRMKKQLESISKRTLHL